MDDLKWFFTVILVGILALAIGFPAWRWVQNQKPYPTDPAAQRVRAITDQMEQMSTIRYDVYQQLMNSALYGTNDIPEWVVKSMEETQERLNRLNER